MTQIAALFWLRLGAWLGSKGMDAAAQRCYRYAGDAGGKTGAVALLHVAKKFFINNELKNSLEVYQESVRCDPDNGDAWCGLGTAHRQLLQLEDARRCYDRALEIDPANLHALTNLGEWHLVKGETTAALACFERVLEQAPLFHDALGNRIAALIECGKLVEAEITAMQAVAHYPGSAALQVNLGIVLERCGKPKLALKAYQKALELQPDNPEAKCNLAILQGNGAALRNSVNFIRRTIELRGASAYLQRLLAIALQHEGRLTEAEAACRDLLERHPEDFLGWESLAGCISARGDPALSVEYHQKALALGLDDHGVYSCIAAESTYISGLTPEALFQRHLAWAGRHEQPLLENHYRHTPSSQEKTHLKIGYVSGDFASHPVGFLLRGILQRHDHAEFEIHCFQTSFVADELTAILRAQGDRWHDAAMLSHVELAGLIHEQGIDILVDLSGHTAFNRLPVFAMRPAPVQATWIGYFHSTGLRSIDYFITDPHTTPPGARQFFSEIPVWLPHSRFCYTPPEFAPEVSESPCGRNGYVTFGSFNRTSKLTDPVVAAWSRIMTQVPDAKLILKAREFSDAETAERLRQRFEGNGLAPDRLILRQASDHVRMFEEYADVDIALDTFPFNGGMTTLEALWMGVPVVALAGHSVASRQSVSILANIGHEELIFPDVASYVAGAVALARDSGRITHLRGAMRGRMSLSPLCDAKTFTHDLEVLYRQMWQAWCGGEKLGLHQAFRESKGERFSSPFIALH
jgi:predicted O-linked N-acetylglucosamine transferase (SPINDLY family)